MSRLIFLSTITVLAACNPYDPDLGPSPFRCGASEPLCPSGYVCDDEVCMPTAGDDDVVDAASSGFACADDSSVEGSPGNNDTLARAFVTSISDTPTYALRGLAICPGSDKDHFKIQINQPGINFSASVTSVAGHTALSLNLLNASGTLIASGAPVPGSAQQVALNVPNRLATGEYFVLVQAQDATENNYDLSIKVCTQPLPCP